MTLEERVAELERIVAELSGGGRGRKKRNSRRNDYSTGFEAAWRLYPHYEQRSKKTEAFRRWKQQGLECFAHEVLRCIDRARRGRDWTKERGAMVPGFQVWIKDRDFCDLLPETQPNLGSGLSDRGQATHENLGQWLRKGKP